MDREERDFRSNRTLTERIERLEEIVTGKSAVEPMRDEGDLHAVFSRQGRDGIGQDITEPATAFEEIINRIQASTERVFRQATKLEEIGNRVMGALPMEAGRNGGEEREPNGTLDHTFAVLDYLDIALARLETAAIRLERV